MFLVFSATIDNIVQLETCIELINSNTQDVTCSVGITLSESALALISKLSLVSEVTIKFLFFNIF